MTGWQKRMALLLMACACLSVGCAKGAEEPRKHDVPDGSVAENPGVSRGGAEAGVGNPARFDGGVAYFNGVSKATLLKMEWGTVLKSGQSWYGGFAPEKFYLISAQEACNNMLYPYSWHPDGREDITNRERAWNLLFSGPAWFPGSVCVGISLEFGDVFDTWDNDAIYPEAVEMFFDGVVEWRARSVAEAPHYRYKLDFGDMKVYSNEDGTLLLADVPVLIQMGGNEITGPLQAFQDERLPPGRRGGEAWAAINRHIAELGQDLEEIGDAYGSKPSVDEWGDEIYTDENGVARKFEKDGACFFVDAPAAEAFPQLAGGDMGVYAFLEMMGVDAEWGIGGDIYGYGCLYSFWFEDALVFVSSTPERAITKDSRIFIKRS